MKSKLALVVVVLVVLPTALLSLMAGSLVKRWELIAMRGLETAAENSVLEVRDHVGTRLDAALDNVLSEMAGAIRRGGEFQDIRRVALDAARTSELVAETYLFMNPWGFVYPEGEERDSSQSVGLTGELRRALASAPPGATHIGLTIDGSTYCFAPVREKKGLYAGFRIQPEGIARLLSNVMKYDAVRGLALAATGLLTGEGGDGVIVVSDSLSGSTNVVQDSVLPKTAVLAEGALAVPLEFVVLTAHADDPAQIEANARFTARLFGWGVILLAGVIIVGAGTVVREALVEIREARARTDFVGGVSHDLRTPVASMKVLSESLYLGHVRDPAKRREFLARMVTECDRLSQLVERVLFFVRFGQNAFVFGPRDVDPRHLVEGTVDAFLSRTSLIGGASDIDGDAQVRGMREEDDDAGHASPVVLDLEEDLPSIKVDEAALRQVLLNLLDNAMKYGRRDRPMRVSANVVRCGRSPFSGVRKWVRISVRDEGMGIDKPEQGRIFRKFYRTSGAHDRNVSGVGLGLALCRHVVRAHGGWIGVESEVGKGSTFSVYLPVA